MKNDLTQLEIPRLPEVFNLTDGHAHRPFDKNEQAIVDQLAKLFTEVNREQQLKIEDGYLTAFYGLTGQTINKNRARYFFLPSASISLEIVGNYLRMRKLSLALTEPCFDNLANIFKRHDVPLEPIADTCLEEDNFGGILSSIQSDAICIVSPNNPTGIAYTQDNFERLVAYCKQQGKLLILDTSFRAYRPKEAEFDEYKLLQDSEIDFVVIEDTGKTWPTKELKTSILAISASLYEAFYDIYSDFIYHHSPFTLQLLTRFIHNSKIDNLQSVHGIVAENRKALYEALQGTFLESTEKIFSSVAWLAIKNKKTATEVVSLLAEDGIFVLPGNYFFWSDKQLGDNFIRVALVRDPAIFKMACARLRASLLHL